MYKRLLQAAIITFLLNLLASISQPEDKQSTAVSPSQIKQKLVVSYQ
jgi:hypothetical protein